MSQTPRPRAAVILAAGQGTRMKSILPKVLHKVGGRAMLDRAIDAAEAAGCGKVVVVAGGGGTPVAAHVARRLGAEAVAVQDPPLGTGHAVLAAKAALGDFDGDVVIINGDAPLLSAADIAPLFALREAGADLAVLGFEAADPGAYGRLILGQDGSLEQIVEAKDASPAQLAVRACNSNLMAASASLLFTLLGQVRNDNAKGEYYLTDIVSLARAAGEVVRVAFVSESAVMGVNSQAELAVAEAAFQQGRRAALMAEGVNLVAPETVHLSFDTRIAGGVVVEPFVVFAPGVTVETGAVIRAFSHLEACHVGEGALIGPYARLRPGAEIGQDAHVGNFVEVKNVKLGRGAKANHLTYLGDGTVGEGTNIGAGAIFCNYDGFDKAKTHIGANAFIGSNTLLVAPVTVGDGAFTATGSVITEDVAADALALARARQVEKPGWAAAFRAKKKAAKAKT